MARLIVNQGLQVIGQRASAVPTVPAAITSMAVDNGTAVSNSFVSSHVALSQGGATINSITFKSFSALTTNAQTVQHVSLFATNEANFTIGRVSLHNTVTPTLSTSNLIGGIDQQSLAKTTDFSLQIQVDITYTSA